MNKPLMCCAVVLGLAALMVAAGCAPTPPGKINARLAKHQALYADQETTGDAVVLAKCVRSKVFRETPRGQSVERWFHVIFDVEKVQRGDWDPKTITFVCRETSPSASSGATEGRAQFPYQAGAEMMFYLNTKVKPAMIVGQKRLVPVPAR